MNETFSIGNESVLADKCRLFPGEEWKCDVIIGVRRATASISFVGCVLVVLFIWLFRKHQFFVQRLVLYLSFSALLDNIGFFMGGQYTDGNLCNFEALWITLFEWSVLLWVCCITFNVFLNAILYRKTESYEIAYHIICWILPLIIAVSPLIYQDFYGPSGAWCWIQKEYTTWRFAIWYGPLFIIISVLFVVHAVIIYKMKKRATVWEGSYNPEIERMKKIFEDDAKRLYGYPFVYLITSICPVINRIQNAADPDHPIYALWILHCLFSPLPGAINVIIFGLDQDIRSKLSWLQIKANFLSHFAERTKIREYVPCEDGSVNDSSQSLSP